MLVCSFSFLVFLVYSCNIFSHFFFFVFALAHSALSIFILYDDYFPCCKEIVSAYCLADASILFINWVINMYFEGGPFHWPYWLP